MATAWTRDPTAEMATAVMNGATEYSPLSLLFRVNVMVQEIAKVATKKVISWWRQIQAAAVP